MPLAMSRVWVQDNRYLNVLETRRGFLATRNATYTFVNGQPTGVTYVRNSEAAALVTLPATIVGAFVSGVVSGTSAKSAIATSKASSITTETSVVNAQTSYINAQAALVAAQAKAKASTNTAN